MKVLRIYTDGSCIGQKSKNKNNRSAGIGLFINDECSFNISSKFELENPTNIRAELLASWEAMKIVNENHEDILKNLNNSQKIRYYIYTDCQHVIDIFQGNPPSKKPFTYSWVRKNWKKADGNDPKNLDLIKPMFKLWEELRKKGIIEFRKVKAHQKEPENIDKKNKEYKIWYGNMMADKFATNASAISNE